MKKFAAAFLVILFFALSFHFCPVAMGREQSEPAWADTAKKYYPEWKHNYWVDRELWGNRGYLVGGPSDLSIRPRGESIVTIKDNLEFRGPVTQGKIKTYTVKKGDCLWYIAGYPEIYGNPLRWPLIYKANTDQIKDQAPRANNHSRP